MLRLMLFTLATLSLVAPAARADVIHVEDFVDEFGEPAYDPLFDHELTGLDGNPGNWDLVDISASDPEHDVVLLLGPAHDTISFLLQPGEAITYAKLEMKILDEDRAGNSIYFFGSDEDGYCFMQHSRTVQWETFEITAKDIEGLGALHSIEINAGEAYLDNITIHVVPEPSVIIIGLIGLIFCLACKVTK